MIDRTSRGSLWLRIICAVAVLCLAFITPPVVARTVKAGPAAMAAFMLPDGTLPDLCLDDPDGPDHSDPHGKCLSCCLPTSFLPPTPDFASLAPPPLISLGRMQAFAADLPAQVLSGARSARGPPSFLPA